MKIRNVSALIVLLLFFSLFLFFSCIKDDFNDPPSKVGFHGSLALPVGSFEARIPSLNLSVYDSVVQGLLPDSLIPEQYPIYDTLPFKLSGSIEKPEFIEWINFKLEISNLFPAVTTCQVFFADGNMQIFDSLFDARLVCTNSSLSSLGQVQSFGSNFRELAFPAQRIDSFYNVRNIILEVLLINENSDSSLFQYYDSLYVHASLALAIGLNIDF